MNSFFIHKYDNDCLFYIKKAIKEGLDPSVFYKSVYNKDQIKELYYGLKLKLDVSKYSNPAYSSEKMRNIREGLTIGLDTSLYSKLEYSEGKMKAIKESLIYNTYLKEYENVTEHSIYLYNKMQLEGYDKDFIINLAKNNTGEESIKIIIRTNEVLGNKYNNLIIKYPLKDDILKGIFKIALQFPELCNEELFKLFSFDICKKNPISRIIIESIEKGAPLSLCEDFVNDKISKEEFILESDKYLNDCILEEYEINKISKNLNINVQEEYPEDILLNSISLNINLEELIKQGYNYEQLEEINYAVEDNLLEFLNLISPEKTSTELFIIRNKLIIDKFILNLKSKSKNKINLYEFFDVTYNKGYWYIVDKDNEVFYKNNDINIILEKIKDLYELLTKELTTDEILLIIEESKE